MNNQADLTSRWKAFQELFRQNKLSDALTHLRAFPSGAKTDFQWIAHEAVILGRLGDHVGEIERLRKLIQLQPDIASLRVSMANALKTIGRTEEAIVSLRQAIAIEPTYGRAWWMLSDLKTYRFDDADLAAMQKLLASGGRPEDRISLHFALAKAFEDRGLSESSFAQYSEANRLRGKTIDARRVFTSPRVDRSIVSFTKDFFETRRGLGHGSRAPIFIIGLQRSGSTLVEQILSSHPLIEATSELPLIPQLSRQIAKDPGLHGNDLFERISALDERQLEALGKSYIDRAAAFRHTDRPYFIDKLPSNWSNVGLIRSILPKAKIVDARRHPLAVGYSNFKQNYATGAAFSFSLSTIGRYYRDYLRLITHFERIDPGAIHRVVNEQLIGNLEGEVRELLAYLELPYDPACMNFHLNPRAVSTPSAEQVRQPINRGGVDQWRAVEPWLGPLKDALGPALEGWNMPSGTYLDDL